MDEKGNLNYFFFVLEKSLFYEIKLQKYSYPNEEKQIPTPIFSNFELFEIDTLIKCMKQLHNSLILQNGIQNEIMNQ